MPLSFEDKLREGFRLIWGEAPSESLKGKKGKEIEEFITNILNEYKSSLKEEIYGKKVDISLRKRVDNPDDAMLNDCYNMAIDHVLKLID